MIIKKLITLIFMFSTFSSDLISVLQKGAPCTFKKNPWYRKCTIIRTMTYDEIEKELQEKSKLAQHFIIDCEAELDSEFSYSEFFKIIKEDFKKNNSYRIFGKNFTFAENDPPFYLAECICKKHSSTPHLRIIHESWIIRFYEIENYFMYEIEPE